MVRIFMRMTQFFTMAIFWNYMDFAWFIRKDKDSLQVQREYCNALCNGIQRLEESLKVMETSSKKKVLNKNQCVHLFCKLLLAMKGIDQMLSSAIEDLKFQSIFEELCFLQRKVEIVGRNCIDEDQWRHSAVYQIQSKETFRELLLDLKCCYDIACEMHFLCHPSQLSNILSIQFDAATYEQVLEDGQELKRRLELELQGEMSADYEIVQHLLLRLRNLDRVDGGDLTAFEVPNGFKTLHFIEKIGKGGYGDVYKSNWLGLACATKVLEVERGNLMDSRKEAGILAGLSHPNLVQFFGCGITKKVGENPKEDETSEMHLVMELMDSNLSTILKKAKRPLPYLVAIDIMHQIAKGVYYLHDMQVAHLDLKPDNILYNSIHVKNLDPHWVFKVMDYGTSQLEVCSNPKTLKPSDFTIGTPRYMAPEMMKESKTPRYPFQADVWSFAMMCSEILSRKVPYIGLKPKDFRDQISPTHGSSSKGLRPNLPNNCKELTSLIEECWSQDPLHRPTFSKICESLTSLKKSFLMGKYSWEMVPQFGSCCTLRDSKSMVVEVAKVNEQIAPPKKVIVDLEHQLSRAKELLAMKYIGIVGMGGIGKTTLAKAMFDDATVKVSYHASDFVANCKDYQSSYDILCKILSKLGDDKKPKDLGNAQEMMKLLLVGKKVLLILDDIKDDSQVHDIVPPDILKASKGSCVIITTRNWSTIKSFVGIEGKFEVGLLDTEAATMLFTTHLSWSVTPLSPEFEDLCKHVVKACNGLPLSLKVMGSFLRTKERLRSWDRALQRMAKGRNLEGDEGIWNTLQISFDGLNDGVEKGMFLDVACFFCQDVYPSGISRATILSMWSKDGILPMSDLDRLIDMSLLKVNEDGATLEMHDQLRDMGRKLAHDTRVWNASMIPEVGFSSKDVKVLEGISLQGITNHHLSKIKQDQSLAFENLRVLILVSVLGNPQAHVENLGLLLQFASQCSKLEAIVIGGSIFRKSSVTTIGLPPTLQVDLAFALQSQISDLCGTCASLKILDLEGLEFLKEIPREFASNNTLLRLNLSFCSSLVALPKEVGNFSSLTTLDLRGCSSLMDLPKEVGNLSSLTTLDLWRCSSLAALPKEVGNLSLLTTLDLSDCSSLVALPKEVGNLSSLTTLDLSYCSSLVALPKEVGNLSSLTTLVLWRCSGLVSLPKEVGNLSSLTTLNLSGCKRFVTLPKEVGNLSSLTILNLCGSRLVALPKEVENLSSLTTLNLSGCKRFVTLPKEVGNLSLLTTLNLCGCSSLVALPKEVENFSSLTTLDLLGCSSLVALPKEVGNLSSLTKLSLWGCFCLVALPEEVGNLSSLTTLNLSGCSSLLALPKEVGNLSSLTTLDLNRCSRLAALPKEVGNLSSLTTLDLDGCSNLKALPKEVGNLSSLTTLNLWRCSSLVALPKEVGNLPLLSTLNLSDCSSLVALPKEVLNLSSLTTLDLRCCSSLVALPKEVGNLSSLTTLKLSGCSSLVALPKEVGNLSSLITLHLWRCSSLVALPTEVGNLSLLTSLNLDVCKRLVALPKEVGNLSLLTSLDLSVCERLVALPKEVGNLSLLTSLNLSVCKKLVALPKEVGNLSSLTTLDLSDCSSLVALPKEVGNLSSLTTLDLSYCSSLVALPKEVGNLSLLTTLDLRDCSSLMALPKEVGNLSSLTTLNLRYYSSLVAMPKEVGNLSFLTTLDLSYCSSLVALPKEVGNLSSLTTLVLWRCSGLVSLPKEVGNLSSLTTLDLQWCSSLVALPKEVGNLSSLTTLDLRGCSSLVALPQEVGNLSSLTTLDLRCCSSLVALPKEVGNLSSLTTLELNYCSSLAALPKEVGNLSSLTTLDLSYCSSLVALPEEVENLSSLTTLNLRK